MSDIGAAIAGVAYLRDFLKYVRDLRQDAETLGKVTDAMARVGEVQDKLHELREENLQLLETNRQLQEQLRAATELRDRRNAYKLVKAPGGGMVLQSDGPPVHYACPACAEDGAIHVLQDSGVYSGAYHCPSCSASYSVDPRRQPPQLRW